MKRNNIIIWALSCILFLSCGERELTPLEYVKWVENPENGLVVKKQMGNYNFLLQYQPIAYNVLNELQKEEVEAAVLQKEIESKEGLQYLTIKMSTIQKKPIFSGKNLTDSIRSYLNYQIKKDFYLLEGGDTLPCQLFHYENTNGMTPYDAFVLGFKPSQTKLNDKKFLFKANIIDVEQVEMEIKNSAIQSIPKVKTI
jgi:hypothetical protein